MCKPLPGPRCAAHTAAAIDAAQVRLVAAVQARDDLAEARRTGPDGQFTLGQIQAVHAEVAAANAALSAARDEHDSTPTGQRELHQIIDTLMDCEDEPDTAEIERLNERLMAGQARRAQAEADLAAATAQQERLMAATPEEQRHLDAADAAVAAAEGALVVARDNLSHAEAAAHPFQQEVDRLQPQYTEALRNITALKAEVDTAAHAVIPHARRLYEAAGVSPAMARYYAGDMIDNAREVRPRMHSAASGPVVRPLEIKVKRNGGDREATLAAKAAAETDEQFQSANAVVGVATAALADGRARLSQDIGRRYDEAITALQGKTREVSRAREALTDVENRLTAAESDRNRLYARVGAGLGAGSVRQVAISRAGDEIVRNPDGSINAYVYRAPSPGFPHGRMVRATGVTTRQGWSPANALTMEDGTTVVASEHYYRTTGGARSDSADPLVVLTDAHPDARPLRAENVASAGFSVFVDSTD